MNLACQLVSTLSLVAIAALLAFKRLVGPPGTPGTDGRDGKNGIDGRDGSVLPVPRAYSFVSAGGVDQDSTVVIQGSGKLTGLIASNLCMAARYVKVYDCSESPTAADTPKLRIPLQPTRDFLSDVQADFTHGLAFRITTGLDDQDKGTCTAGHVVLNFMVSP